MGGINAKRWIIVGLVGGWLYREAEAA